MPEEVKSEDKINIPKEVVEVKKSGQVLQLTGEDGRVYYFKSPRGPDMNRYLTAAAKGKLATAVQDLIFDLAVHPGPDELRQIFKEKPGLMVALNNALQNAVGLNEEFSVKKL